MFLKYNINTIEIVLFVVIVCMRADKKCVILVSLLQLQVFPLEAQPVRDTTCAYLCGAFLYWLLCCQQYTSV